MKRFVMTAAMLFSFIAISGRVVRAAEAPDLTSPKSAAMTFAKAMQAGDVETAKATALKDAENQDLVALFAGLVSDNLKLRDAAKAKWGEDAGDKIAGNVKNMDMTKQLEESEVKESGDSATISSPKGGNPVQLKKIDGQWRIDMVASMAGQGSGAQQLAMVKAVGSVMGELAGEIADGKYNTIDEAKSALQTKVFGAMATMRKPTSAPATQPGK